MAETHESAVEHLTDDECWDLLTANDFGRLAVATDTGVDIFPMNFLVRDREIFLRSAPGSKLASITQRPSIAFEVDGKRLRRRWSIVVKGNIDRLGLDSDIVESGILQLKSLNPTAKWNYLRISPESVTGRRFKATRR